MLIRQFLLLAACFQYVVNVYAAPFVRSHLGASSFMYDISSHNVDEVALDPHFMARIQELTTDGAAHDVVSVSVGHPFKNTPLLTAYFTIDGGKDCRFLTPSS